MKSKIGYYYSDSGFYFPNEMQIKLFVKQGIGHLFPILFVIDNFIPYDALSKYENEVEHMARKPKDIYTRIAEKKTQISEAEKKLERYKIELIQLNTKEMHEIFASAKENNLSYKEVIQLISRTRNQK